RCGRRHGGVSVAAACTRCRRERQHWLRRAGGQPMIKVILVDDHTLILRGLRELLSAAPGIAVVGEAVDYASLRTLVRETHPDVVVLDINLPGRSGLDALASLNELVPPPKVLMLSQFAADQYGLRALRAGAMGYLNKSCDPALIVEAVREIAGG